MNGRAAADVAVDTVVDTMAAMAAKARQRRIRTEKSMLKAAAVEAAGGRGDVFLDLQMCVWEWVVGAMGAPVHRI
jgi:hypothetical protein